MICRHIRIPVLFAEQQPHSELRCHYLYCERVTSIFYIICLYECGNKCMEKAQWVQMTGIREASLLLPSFIPVLLMRYFGSRRV